MTIIILYGLSGSGKSYIGQLISKKLHYTHIEGDNWLTDDMRSVISQKKTFSQEMRNEFTKIIINNLSQTNENIVLSQAFYKYKNREEIKTALLKQSKSLFMIRVEANDDVISNRLQQRTNGINEEYANKIKSNFESTIGDFFIYNNIPNNDDYIITEISNILCQGLIDDYSHTTLA